MNQLRKYDIEICVFLSGAIVMILELVGSRILAPYLGTTLYVWTALIGIILASLSLGYWLGGSLSDKDASRKMLGKILLGAGFFILITGLINQTVLQILLSLVRDVKTLSVVSGILLFTPASILLGMVSPYCIKLKLHDLKHAGESVGSLYALSTLGSIFGTFLAGFYLIALLGTSIIIYILPILLAVLAILIENKTYIYQKLALIIFSLILIFLKQKELQENRNIGFVDTDSNYSRIWIYSARDFQTRLPIRSMQIGNENSSARYLNSTDLVYKYTRYYRLSKHINPNIKTALAIGGAGYSYPKDFLKEFPKGTIDVVEIDPKVTELAKEYFNLSDDPRLTSYHIDGRQFLNSNTKKYDVVFLDVFKSFSIPFELTTVEAVEKLHSSLNDNGFAMLNIISPLKGDNQMVSSTTNTYEKVFDNVYVFKVNPEVSDYQIQNLILVALKNTELNTESDIEEFKSYLTTLVKVDKSNDLVLSDEYAPIENYFIDLI